MQDHQVAQRGLRERLSPLAQRLAHDRSRALVVVGQDVERLALDGAIIAARWPCLELGQRELGDTLRLPVAAVSRAARGCDLERHALHLLVMAAGLPALISATLMRAISSRGANGLMM